jgi:3-oxoacyl-[acyl-carrier protein] reductase
MSRFQDVVVLITGGTRGIGRACAERFAAEGARVALCGRNEAQAQAVAAEIGGGAKGYACDIAHKENVDDLIKAVTEDLGPIQVLVNNAGITRDGLLMRMKDADWEDVIATNLGGTFHLCRATARGMLKQRAGRIINMTSIVGVRGQGGQTNYSAAKAGIIGFTKAYAQEVASRGITVNCVAPGLIQTDMTAGLGDDAIEKITAQVPLKRAGTPQDVAGVVAFLASEDASYLTGAVLPVDGGLGM